MKKSMVDDLGLSLKRPLRSGIVKPSQMVGNMILNDIGKANPIAEKYDFAQYTQKEYIALLEDGVNDGISKIDGDFYLEVSFARDKLLKKVYKMVPVLRKSCPLPFYGKDVYFYDSKHKKLEVLWAIPPKDLCEHPELIPLEIAGKDELLKTIANFNSGYYFKIYEKLNESKFVGDKI